MSKKCSRCKLIKTDTDFYTLKNKKGQVGLYSACKECQKIMAMDWTKRNKDKHKISMKKYYNTLDKSKVRKWSNASYKRIKSDPIKYEEKKRQMREANKRWRENNPVVMTPETLEQKRLYRKEYYQRNKIILCQKAKAKRLKMHKKLKDILQ